MSKKFGRLPILSLSILLMGTLPSVSANVTAAPPSVAPKKMLQGKTSANETIDQLEGVGIKCAIHQGTKNLLVVDKVRFGSAASYKGLSEGDIVAAVTPYSDGFNLDFVRGQNKYRIFLRSQLTPPSRFKNDSEADKFLESFEKQITDTQQERSRKAQLEKDAPKYEEEAKKQGLSNKSAAKIGDNAVSAEEIATTRGKAIKQGDYPNCWFEASLAAVVDEPDGHKKVADMIKKVGERNFRVTFPEQAFYGAAKYVDVDVHDIEEYGMQDATLWARILDCACTKRILGDDRVQNDSGLKMLTGLPTHELLPGKNSEVHIAQALAKITDEHAPAIMGTVHGSNSDKLPENHAYTIVAFDKKTGVVTIRNPWSGDPLLVGKQDYSHASPIADEDGVRTVGDGYIQVTLKEVAQNFSAMIWASK